MNSGMGEFVWVPVYGEPTAGDEESTANSYSPP